MRTSRIGGMTSGGHYRVDEDTGFEAIAVAANVFSKSRT